MRDSRGKILVIKCKGSLYALLFYKTVQAVKFESLYLTYFADLVKLTPLLECSRSNSARPQMTIKVIVNLKSGAQW